MIDLVYTSIENIETIKYMLSSHLTEPVRQKMERTFSTNHVQILSVSVENTKNHATLSSDVSDSERKMNSEYGRTLSFCLGKSLFFD